MTSTHAAVEELDERRCWSLLAGAEVARLALVVDAAPVIFPVNHLLDGRRLLVRTAAGTKLFAAVGCDVAVEVDGTDGDRAWSVVAEGVGTEVRDERGLALADEHLLPWLDSDKPHVLGVELTAVQGRAFDRRPRVPGTP